MQPFPEIWLFFEVSLATAFFTPGLPYLRIYRPSPEIWRIWKAFGCIHFCLAIWRISCNFWKHLSRNFLAWRNVRHVYLHVFAYIFIWIFTIFELADSLKIHDTKWKCGSFESRSMVLNTFYQICLQNVEADYLEIFTKCWKPIRFLVKYKVKDKRASNDWFPGKKLLFW